MTGFNYVQLHVGDFIGAVLHMDATEVGAYTMLLLAHYQAGEIGLPDDDKKLARIAKVSTKTWARIKPVVMDKFYLENAFWKNSRAVNEFQKRLNISTDQRARALKRWDKRMPDALPETCITNNQEPITNNLSIEYVSPKVETDKKSKVKSERGKRLSAHLGEQTSIPQDWGDWAYNELGLSVQDIDWEWGKFRDYWKAASGNKGVKMDWQATWRNWARRKSEEKKRKETLNELYSQKRNTR